MKKIILIFTLLLAVCGCSSSTDNTVVPKGKFRRVEDTKDRENYKWDMIWEDGSIESVILKEKWDFKLNGEVLSLTNQWNKANYQCRFRWEEEGQSYKIFKLKDIHCPFPDDTTFTKVKEKAE